MRSGDPHRRHNVASRRNPLVIVLFFPKRLVGKAIFLKEYQLSLIKLSIRLNGVYIPPQSVESALGRYVEALMAHNEHEVFRVNLCGSAVPIRFRDRYLLVCTHHQVATTDLETVSLLTRDGSHVVTSGGARHFIDKKDSDRYDLALFDFTEPCTDLLHLRERFFHLRDIPPDMTSDKVVAVIVSGFPFSDQKYELEEKNHLGLAKRMVTCLLDSQPSDEAMLRVRPVEPLDFDPDGMSGGSAFVVHMAGGELHAHFAGIVMRGGREGFYILKAGVVREFLSLFIERTSTPSIERTEM